MWGRKRHIEIRKKLKIQKKEKKEENSKAKVNKMKKENCFPSKQTENVKLLLSLKINSIQSDLNGCFKMFFEQKIFASNLILNKPLLNVSLSSF